MTRPDPDRMLLRRAQRRLATLLVVGGIALLMVTHGQHTALATSLRQTAASEEDVIDPPEDSWIFRLDAAGKLTTTDDTPHGFPDQDAIARVRAGGPAETESQEIDGVDYVIVTRQRQGTTVQVVGRPAHQEAARHRLLMALAAADLLGLLAAAGAGILFARRATAPLGDALDRQRRFVADAGHELRTPLAQLHTRAQLPQGDLRDGGPAEQAVRDVDRLVAGSRDLGEPVEDRLLSTQGVAGAATEVDLGVLAATGTTWNSC